MTGPNFYTIDFDREIVLQGQSTTFVTIARNDFPGVAGGNGDVYIMLFPNTKTFHSYYSGTGDSVESYLDGTSVSNVKLSNPDNQNIAVNQLSFNNVGFGPSGSYIKNSNDFVQASDITMIDDLYLDDAYGVNYVKKETGGTGSTATYYTSVTVSSLSGSHNFSITGTSGSTATMHLGSWDWENSNDSWKINGKKIKDLEYIAYTTPTPPSTENSANFVNVFDGSVQSFSTEHLQGTGYVGRDSGGWAIIKYDPNVQNASITLRIDYDGSTNSHMKLNFVIWKVDPRVRLLGYASPLQTKESFTGIYNTESYINPPYGTKSGSLGGEISNYVDYQETHFFGYTEEKNRTSRETWQNTYKADTKIYEDLSSYSLLKTNPKISGNVKITQDSNGDIWLNSIDANNELSDSSYKKFPISSKSTYAKDLYTFFKNGKTPTSTVFDLYQVDTTYENTKRNLYEQFDNFYNYGVENLKNRYYDESFSFFAPLWLRSNVPDFFIIFRLDHPLSAESYNALTSNPAKFSEFFTESQIVKTFDMRKTSKLGSYIRKITDDPRFKETPLDVSFDQDIATTWNGISYANGTMSGKGEFLYDYWRKDRPIIEFEEYITGGFERNGIISTNLLNLEFLFNDETATPYTINRYFGLYVTENQLANFQIAPNVISQIPNQTPLPRKGVDGEPYSTKSFHQTNANGIQLPVNYFHNPSLGVNNTNIPTYQGDVVGKFPLPIMVEDPLRIFYVKDRNDNFKRIKKLAEAEYGLPGSENYARVTQIELFEKYDDISNYAGVNQITSQATATLLDEGNAQLRLHLSAIGEEHVFADQEVLELTVDQFNHDDQIHTYYLRLSYQDSNTLKFLVFKDQYVEKIPLMHGFSMPSVGGGLSMPVLDITQYAAGQYIYITNVGQFQVVSLDYTASAINIVNSGSTNSIAPGTFVNDYELFAIGLPAYEIEYTYDILNEDVTVDTLLTISITDSVPSYDPGVSYKINVKDSAVNIINLINTPNTINAKLTASYPQYRWRMIANSTGLRPGESWDYPVEDINNHDWVTSFNNVGTPSQVAQAVASAINSFVNRPCDAVAYNEVIYLKSKLTGNLGNNIVISRNMIDGVSNIYNLGFYDHKNVDIAQSATVLKLGTDFIAYPITTNFLDRVGTCGNVYTYLKFKKSTPTGPVSGYYAQIRLGVDPSSIATARNTGTEIFNAVTLPDNIFVNENIPYSVDISNLPFDEFVEYVIEQNIGPLKVSQKFIGGDDRRRNRAKIAFNDSERYYSDRRIRLFGDITSGSDIIRNVNLDGVYVGASVIGSGIPSNTIVNAISMISGILYISNQATATVSNVKLEIGELNIINTAKIKDQWFQTQKGLYSPIYGWDVQGNYVYSLPYLEEPVYDAKNRLQDFTDIGGYSVIQVTDSTQEFYQTLDKRIVAYNLYRPILGVFSIYPIKEFDFDFIFSDYSYTPIIESFRYFFNETLKFGDKLILPANENWIVKCSDNGNYDIEFEAYNIITGVWEKIATVNAGYTEDSLMLNTYYPFYVYDEFESPVDAEDINNANVYHDTPIGKNYSIQGSGLRNYMSRIITYRDTLGNLQEYVPSSFRISFTIPSGSSIPSSATFNIKKNDYSQDKDIEKFQGFASLEDIQTQEDVEAFRALVQEGNNVDAYLSQILKTEYDRLRENYNKSYAVKSKVVPYIGKWVQTGTDARDNYYRLNMSKAFGITNLSPDTSVNFSEASLLTNEFPYLDTVPKDYPEESLEGSRSYMFAKLSDVADPKSGKSWYDLMTTDTTDDWFTKYFAIGYPTEITSSGSHITKSREERFTFLSYNEGIKRSQTLFRGGKIQAIDLNTQINPPVEISGSTKYNGYKFAAIARVIPHTPLIKEKPVSIEVCKNDTFKSILMIITIKIQDYRIQSGLNDYLFFYAVNDQLKNYGQQQVAANFLDSGKIAQDSLTPNKFAPYADFNIGSYTDLAKMRPRQGFLGAGYVELGDTLLGGVSIESTTNPVSPHTGHAYTFNMESNDPTYSFSVLDEIIPTLDNYKLKSNTYYTNPSVLNVLPSSLTQDGSLYKLLNVVSNGSDFHQLINRQDSRLTIDKFLPSQITFSSSPKPIVSKQLGDVNPYKYLINQYSFVGSGTSHPVSQMRTVETFNIKGGTDAYVHIKNLLTYASILSYVNEGSSFIEYYSIADGVKNPANDYSLQFIQADQIIKTGVLAYVNDEDKPIEYIGSNNIGYNIVDTNQNEVIYRHRGSYEPKSRDVLSFWVREDKAMTEHFDKDFLLSNTHFNDVSPLSGLIRNYGINKVSDNEVLKISKSSAYQSLYPILSEVSIDVKDTFVFDSTWDKAYYRKYYDKSSWISVDGIYEMKEFKSFMGSKAMNIPNTLQLETFNSSELTYSVIEPAVGVGVKQLSTKTTEFTDVNGNSNPILSINIDVSARLLRQMIEGISASGSFDEFLWLQTLGITEFNSLAPADILKLKTDYLTKNILQLYQISQVNLYSLSKEGILIVDTTLSESQKIGSGYRIDKNCKVVTDSSTLATTITKQLDTKKPHGYAVEVVLTRI